MTGAGPAAALTVGAALLERAIGYALGQVHVVTGPDLSRRTPCAEWDLGRLLAHIDDSLAALQEALDLARVGAAGGDGTGSEPGPAGSPVSLVGAGSGPGPAGSPVSLVGAVRSRASRLLGALAGADDSLVWVGGLPVPAGLVASAGAIDVAVHGWDVARACGRPRRVPGRLAGEMLEIAPLLITRADRPALFAAPVQVPPGASASDRLVAYLGRDPAAG